MRTLLIAMLLLALAGCTGEEHACTAIGTPVGVGIEVPAGTTHADVEVCWDAGCVTRPMDFPGGHGFADVPGLPAKPVRVTAKFGDGKPHSVTATPGYSEPNGPGCGKGGPQLQLVAGPGHELRPR